MYWLGKRTQGLPAYGSAVDDQGSKGLGLETSLSELRRDKPTPQVRIQVSCAGIAFNRMIIVILANHDDHVFGADVSLFA